MLVESRYGGGVLENSTFVRLHLHSPLLWTGHHLSRGGAGTLGRLRCSRPYSPSSIQAVQRPQVKVGEHLFKVLEKGRERLTPRRILLSPGHCPHACPLP